LVLITTGYQGQVQGAKLVGNRGPDILKHALEEEILSNDRKLPKETREAHLNAYHLEIKRAFEQLLNESTSGQIDSMFRLGAYGRTFEKEGLTTREECFPWLELAATKGHSEAPFDLALELLDSKTPSEKAKGFDWLKRATRIGGCRWQAAVRLVHYYSYGFPELAIHRNPKTAWSWAKKGADFYGTSVGEFLVENGLQDPDKVKDGEILFK
jgi:TPR repeat protein